MKKYVSIIAAIAAVLSSCQKEQAPAPVKFTVGASIAQTKTVMGTPDGSSCPVLWQAGDVLNVNGVASAPLSQGGASAASFEFDGLLGPELNAVYPSSVLKSYSEGSAVVTLPSVQNYTVGSFDSASAVLVGKGTGADVTLSNAMAYMSITPALGSENVKIKSIQLNSFGGVLCGDFATDFANLTPVDGNTGYRVTVQCETPVELGTPIIVAIPAASYNGKLEMTIVDENDNYMKVTSNFSESKPFNALAGHVYPTSVTYKHYVKPMPEALYMLGDGTPGGWSSTTVLASTSYGVYAVQGIQLAGGNFKVYAKDPYTSGEWFPYYAEGDGASNGNITVKEVPSEQPGDPNFNIERLGYAAGKYDVLIDLNQMKMTLTAQAPDPEELRIIYLYGACFTGKPDWDYWCPLQETAAGTDVYSASVDFKVWEDYNRGFKIYRSQGDWSNEYCVDWNKSVGGDPNNIWFGHKNDTGDNQVCPVDFGFTDSGFMTVTVDFVQMKVTFTK